MRITPNALDVLLLLSLLGCVPAMASGRDEASGGSRRRQRRRQQRRRGAAANESEDETDESDKEESDDEAAPSILSMDDPPRRFHDWSKATPYHLKRWPPVFRPPENGHQPAYSPENMDMQTWMKIRYRTRKRYVDWGNEHAEIEYAERKKQLKQQKEEKLQKIRDAEAARKRKLRAKKKAAKKAEAAAAADEMASQFGQLSLKSALSAASADKTVHSNNEKEGHKATVEAIRGVVKDGIASLERRAQAHSEMQEKIWQTPNNPPGSVDLQGDGSAVSSLHNGDSVGRDAPARHQIPVLRSKSTLDTRTQRPRAAANGDDGDGDDLSSSSSSSSSDNDDDVLIDEADLGGGSNNNENAAGRAARRKLPKKKSHPRSLSRNRPRHSPPPSPPIDVNGSDTSDYDEDDLGGGSSNNNNTNATERAARRKIPRNSSRSRSTSPSSSEDDAAGLTPPLSSHTNGEDVILVVDPALVSFVEQNAACIIGSPSDFCNLLVNENIESFRDLAEALEEEDFFDDALKAGERDVGVKGFKKHKFLAAIKSLVKDGDDGNESTASLGSNGVGADTVDNCAEETSSDRSVQDDAKMHPIASDDNGILINGDEDDDNGMLIDDEDDGVVGGDAIPALKTTSAGSEGGGDGGDEDDDSSSDDDEDGNGNSNGAGSKDDDESKDRKDGDPITEGGGPNDSRGNSDAIQDPSSTPKSHPDGTAAAALKNDSPRPTPRFKKAVFRAPTSRVTKQKRTAVKKVSFCKANHLEGRRKLRRKARFAKRRTTQQSTGGGGVDVGQDGNGTVALATEEVADASADANTGGLRHRQKQSTAKLSPVPAGVPVSAPPDVKSSTSGIRQPSAQYRRLHALQDAGVAGVVTSIVNRGANCYINAMSQILLSSSRYRALLKHFPYSASIMATFAVRLDEAIVAGIPLDCDGLVNAAIGLSREEDGDKKNMLFVPGKHEDAAELLRNMHRLDGGAIHALGEGVTGLQRKYTCNRVISRTDPGSCYVTLTIPPRQASRTVLLLEDLVGEKWGIGNPGSQCEPCNLSPEVHLQETNHEAVDVNKETNKCGGKAVHESNCLQTKPSEIIIQVARFTHSGGNAAGQKNEMPIYHPRALRIRASHDGSVVSVFVLEAVLAHNGSLDSGHFYCYVLRNGAWYELNDPSRYPFGYTGGVSRKSEAEVMKITNGYMYRYRRLSTNETRLIPNDHFMSTLPPWLSRDAPTIPIGDAQEEEDKVRAAKEVAELGMQLTSTGKVDIDSKPTPRRKPNASTLNGSSSGARPKPDSMVPNGTDAFGSGLKVPIGTGLPVGEDSSSFGASVAGLGGVSNLVGLVKSQNGLSAKADAWNTASRSSKQQPAPASATSSAFATAPGTTMNSDGALRRLAPAKPNSNEENEDPQTPMIEPRSEIFGSMFNGLGSSLHTSDASGTSSNPVAAAAGSKATIRDPCAPTPTLSPAPAPTFAQTRRSIDYGNMFPPVVFEADEGSAAAAPAARGGSINNKSDDKVGDDGRHDGVDARTPASGASNQLPAIARASASSIDSPGKHVTAESGSSGKGHPYGSSSGARPKPDSMVPNGTDAFGSGLKVPIGTGLPVGEDSSSFGASVAGLGGVSNLVGLVKSQNGLSAKADAWNTASRSSKQQPAPASATSSAFATAPGTTMNSDGALRRLAPAKPNSNEENEDPQTPMIEPRSEIFGSMFNGLGSSLHTSDASGTSSNPVAAAAGSKATIRDPCAPTPTLSPAPAPTFAQTRRSIDYGNMFPPVVFEADEGSAAAAPAARGGSINNKSDDNVGDDGRHDGVDARTPASGASNQLPAIARASASSIDSPGKHVTAESGRSGKGHPYVKQDKGTVAAASAATLGGATNDGDKPPFAAGSPSPKTLLLRKGALQNTKCSPHVAGDADGKENNSQSTDTSPSSVRSTFGSVVSSFVPAWIGCSNATTTTTSTDSTVTVDDPQPPPNSPPRSEFHGDIAMEQVNKIINNFKHQASNRLFKDYTHSPVLSEDDVLVILDEAIARHKEKPSVADVSVPENGFVIIVGDIHGQYLDLVEILRTNRPKNSVIVFNGDIVDRGDMSFECIIVVLLLSLADPERTVILRGNHESDSVNSEYGFHAEILVRNQYSRAVLAKFVDVFSHLQIAAVVGEKVFIAHGGVPTGPNVTLDDIRSIQRGCEPENDPLMLELLWNDPDENYGVYKNERGVGFTFGPDVTLGFLQRNNLSRVVRSHQMRSEGYEKEHNGTLITVFSAPNYCNSCCNGGAIICFDELLECEPIQFGPTHYPM